MDVTPFECLYVTVKWFVSIIVFFLIGLGLYLLVDHKSEEVVYRRDVAELGALPDWSELGAVSSGRSIEELENTLKNYFVIGDKWGEYFSFSEPDEFHIKNSTGSITLNVRDKHVNDSRYWRKRAEMPVRTSVAPLAGIKIAIDPGHIGGKCAKLEERWFQINDDLPVMEGEMTLFVAQLIKPQLEDLGAVVTLTRSDNKPVGTQRSPHFRALAEAKVRALGRDDDLVDLYADKLFYRTAEIRARAHIVNHSIRPDLVIALHFNAEAWGDPADPELTENNHFHILLNGAYTEGELAHEDERFEMTRRLLEGTIHEELLVSKSFVTAFHSQTGLPPYHYEPDSKRAIQLDEAGYIWARNLLANRLFQCPVIYLEPYVMNSHEVHERVQLGDYRGTKLINNEPKKSIFREYADSVVMGLVEYYTQ